MPLPEKGCGERGGSPCPRPSAEVAGARTALRPWQRCGRAVPTEPRQLPTTGLMSRVTVVWALYKSPVRTKPLARRTLRVACWSARAVARPKLLGGRFQVYDHVRAHAGKARIGGIFL